MSTNVETNNSQHVQILTENARHGHTDEPLIIQYIQSQSVGQGSFGVVYQINLIPNNDVYAIKRVLQDKRFKNRELQLMKLLRHQNIVDLRYYYHKQTNNDEVYLHLVLEFMPETLFKASQFYLARGTIMPLLEIKLYTYQLLRALNFIHCQGICHRDLKPQNLLVNPLTGELKLCDFGSAKILNAGEPNVSYICTRYYRAPELIFGSVNYTTQIDIWSTACVVAELIIGRYLFPGDSGIDQLVEIIKVLGSPTREQVKHMNPSYMEHKFPKIKPIPFTKLFKRMPLDCLSLLSSMLQYSPLERATAIQCLAHPFFNELRSVDTKLPVYRKQLVNGNSYELESIDLPPLFSFNAVELSVKPELNNALVPEWAHEQLQINYPLNHFVPLSAEDMKINQI